MQDINTASKTRAPRCTDRSPEYNEHFYYKLDFLANQKAWQLYLWNQSKKQTRGQKALNQAQPRSIISILAIRGRPFDSRGGGRFLEINILTLKILEINNLSSSGMKINNLT